MGYMKNHVWRPLYIAIGIVVGMLLLRLVIVPKDFGVYEKGYMYSWHRKSNEGEWQAVKVKYKTAESCKECHKSNYDDLKSSPHASIGCENCHGPLLDHPKDPKKLNIDISRALCLRCHALLPYPDTGRGKIPGINPDKHYTQSECIMCHYPHNPKKPGQHKEKREVTS